MFRCSPGSTSTRHTEGSSCGTEFPEGGTGSGYDRRPGEGRRSTPDPSPGDALRRWLSTTPGRLRVASVVLLVGLLVVGVVAGAAASARGDAARAVGLDAVPELVAAEDLYGSLADADATASIIFLKAGREAPALRQRYERDIRDAGDHLAAVARRSERRRRRSVRPSPRSRSNSRSTPATSRPLVRTAASASPSAPRICNAASTLMRDQILPAATTVYEHAATRLDGEYQSGTSTTEIVLVVLAGVVLLGLLVGVQLLVTRRSNRLLNIGLVGATVLVVILFGWTLVRFDSAQNSLVDAQRKGSDAVQLLSAARILTLQAQADENTTLIERGGGEAYVEDFERVTKRLGGTDGGGGFLGTARAVAQRTGSEASLDPIMKNFVTFTDDARRQFATPTTPRASTKTQ